jgi:REP element-mobilizing transposase RayT
MSMVLAYHTIMCTHGFWLPNDPRGSWSTEVRFEPLRRFGDATKTDTRRSVAGKSHDRAKRKAAKSEMVYPEVLLSDDQVISISKGFAEQVKTSGFRIHACSIMAAHVHMVIARHSYDIEQVGRLMKQAGTRQLLTDGLHPFAEQRSASGRLPSIWAQDFWKVFLFDVEAILRSIRYVEGNPIKEGNPSQKWDFVVPFDPSDYAVD